MAEKKGKKKQDTACRKEVNAEFRKEAGSAFTGGGNAAYQPRDANTGKPGHGAAGKRRAEKSMQAHQETFGQKVQKLKNGVLYVLWNGQNKTPGTAYRQTECTGCPQGSPKGWGCRTNVRQLILYIQHKTPSFEKPGVRGIISLCD